MFTSGVTKPALREIYRLSLPEMIVDRKHKVAFDCLAQRDRPTLAATVPPIDWFLVANEIIDPVALDRLLVSANNRGDIRKRVLWIEAVELCAQMFMLDR